MRAGKLSLAFHKQTTLFDPAAMGFAHKVGISRKMVSMAYLVHSTYPYVFDFVCKAGQP